MPFGKHKSIVNFLIYKFFFAKDGVSICFLFIFKIAFYGVIFPAEEEAAFSNYRLWESLGFAIVFSYSTAFCIDVKLYILAGVLVVGMIGYLTIEILERIRNNREKFDQNNRIMDVAMKPLRALH